MRWGALFFGLGIVGSAILVGLTLGGAFVGDKIGDATDFPVLSTVLGILGALIGAGSQSVAVEILKIPLPDGQQHGAAKIFGYLGDLATGIAATWLSMERWGYPW